jgi:hypothetical protein
MPKDDPDAQLRIAFALEKAAQTNKNAYREALNLYRPFATAAKWIYALQSVVKSGSAWIFWFFS